MCPSNIGFSEIHHGDDIVMNTNQLAANNFKKLQSENKV